MSRNAANRAPDATDAPDVSPYDAGDVRDPRAPARRRASAPPLPHSATWCAAWLELWRERFAIASEGGNAPVEAAAVADLDLRLAVARGDV
jgi:hypothetical protein